MGSVRNEVAVLEATLCKRTGSAVRIEVQNRSAEAIGVVVALWETARHQLMCRRADCRELFDRGCKIENYRWETLVPLVHTISIDDTDEVIVRVEKTCVL